jgi:hypothetical protein
MRRLPLVPATGNSITQEEINDALDMVAVTSFPPGSLRHLYTKTSNRAEHRTARASTLKLEAE